MIIIKITGGLGNQLFQYALGKNLSLKNKTDLKLEISELKNNTRKYTLDKFNIEADICTEYDIKHIKIPDIESNSLYHRVIWKFLRKYQALLPIPKRKFILEPYFQFNPEVLDLKRDAYLRGVWQSEKYFNDIEEIIRKDITLKNSPSESFKTWSLMMGSCQSVSLHIRRGDYVKNPRTNKFHGTCHPEYYKKAIELISEKIKEPVFFVFSDDIEWAKNNLKIDYPNFFISGEKLPDYEELVLMSKCKHNIIANSTFSWWGAWLNNNKNKIVIAPKKWFNNPNLNTKDLIPENWTII